MPARTTRGGSAVSIVPIGAHWTSVSRKGHDEPAHYTECRCHTLRAAATDDPRRLEMLSGMCPICNTGSWSQALLLTPRHDLVAKAGSVEARTRPLRVAVAAGGLGVRAWGASGSRRKAALPCAMRMEYRRRSARVGSRGRLSGASGCTGVLAPQGAAHAARRYSAPESSGAGQAACGAAGRLSTAPRRVEVSG